MQAVNERRKTTEQLTLQVGHAHTHAAAAPAAARVAAWCLPRARARPHRGGPASGDQLRTARPGVLAKAWARQQHACHAAPPALLAGPPQRAPPRCSCSARPSPPWQMQYWRRLVRRAVGVAGNERDRAIGTRPRHCSAGTLYTPAHMQPRPPRAPGSWRRKRLCTRSPCRRGAGLRALQAAVGFGAPQVGDARA